jgi:gliding motility-associated lipoprotein GldB
MFRRLIVAILPLAVLSGCGPKNPYDKDIGNVEVNLEIKRLEKDLHSVDPDSSHRFIPRFNRKYGEFFEIYNTNVINIGSSNRKVYQDHLRDFLNHHDMNQVYKKILEIYPDLDEVEEKITSGFRHYRYYFPNKLIPAVYTYMGGFNQSIVVADSVLAIGLDKYLGRDCEFYEKLGWEKYRQKNMHKEKIPTDCMRAWGQTEWPFNDSTDNLLSNMLYRGKILYFTKSMLPHEHDTLVAGFTGNELAWCRNNEEQIWNYLIDHKLLYSTDYMTINKMVNPAPFTSGFPQESPGQAVNWLGWQIIEAYMERNGHITLKQLMEDHDYQRILNESRYSP